MNRRLFLQQLAILSAAQTLASCNDEAKAPDKKSGPAVVVGGGIAGLAAAQRLSAKGYTVTLLEASNRVGGRILSDTSFGFPIDMGAAWVHGGDANPFKDIAQKAGCNFYLTQDDKVKVFAQSGTLFSDSELTAMEATYNSLLNQIKTTAADSDTVWGLIQRVNPSLLNNELFLYMLSSYLEFDTGAAANKLGAKFFDSDEVYSGDDLLISNGYETTLEPFTQGITIVKNAAVTAINYQGNTINITSRAGNYEAKKVVIAVPLNILKAKAIQFTPELPNGFENALSDLEMGIVNKVALKFSTPFWDNSQTYFGLGQTSGELGKYSYFLNTNSYAPQTNTLVAIVTGNYNRVYEALTDQQIQTEVMEALGKMFGNNLPQPISIKATRWGQAEFIKGSYTFVPAGGTDAAFSVLATPIANKLAFAGEHTSTLYRGTVHGAWLSGLQAAERVD